MVNPITVKRVRVNQYFSKLSHSSVLLCCLLSDIRYLQRRFGSVSPSLIEKTFVAFPATKKVTLRHEKPSFRFDSVQREPGS